VVINRGFGGRRRRHEPGVGSRLLPPGQHLTDDFPVLSAGPTPTTGPEIWDFRIVEQGGTELARWNWTAFMALPSEDVTVDIHCVTTWSKRDTRWRGVAVDTLLSGLDIEAEFAMAFCDGDYTTNLPLADLVDGKAWVAYGYDGGELEPEHGGPARLLVPHLYFWKSAKWVRGLRLLDEDEPGFWESLGYHDYGDPWREQRYQGD
jgi:DMSO/TMAO reductase YedYZ molybdopterin-dependent catalytic subunit